MCCGNDYDGLEAALAAPSKGGVMAKVFTTVPGAEKQLGSFGQASNDVPAMVPDDIATREFAKVEGFRVELDAPPAKPPTKATTTQKPEKGEER